jgi:DNA-binding transcriptional LysR family regulator
MNYLAWKLFIDTVELGSLSNAAAAWGTSQPNVSRQIQELETECGGRLFRRTGRGVVLTELGKRIAPQIRTWLDRTEQLRNDIRETAGTPIGKVRLGILPSTAHPWIGKLFSQLRKQFPLVQLEVREGQGAQLETWLEEGRVDLAILFRQDSLPGNGDIYLVDTLTYLLGPAGDALTASPDVRFSAIDKIPLALFCRPSSWRDRLDQHCSRHGISLNVVLEADSLALQIEAVAGGDCYALLGPYASFAAKKNYGIQVSKIVEPEIHRYIALAMSPHGELTLACKTVKGLIQDIAQNDSNVLPGD